MSDKLIRVDRKNNKVIFLKTIQQENRSFIEKEIEIDLPQQKF